MLSQLAAAGVIFATVAATLSFFLYLPALAVAESLNPRRAAARSTVWFVALLTPAIAGGLAAGLGLHAVTHDPYGSPHLISGRIHLCAHWLLHLPDARLYLLSAGLAAAAFLAAGLLRLLISALRSQRAAARFRDANPKASDVAIVQHSTAFLATVGLSRPVTVLTSAVVDLMPADELAAALAHELAHQRRADNALDLLGAACVTCLSYCPTVHLFHRYWREDAERACDDYAAAEHSPELVASGIQRLAQVSRERSQRSLLPGTRDGWRMRLDAENRAKRLGKGYDAPGLPRHEVTFAGIVITLAGIGVVALAVAATARQAADSVYCLAETVLRVLGG